METTVVTRIRISAEPADVFEYLANLKYHDLWNPQIRSISSQARLKLGSSYETESEVLGIPITATNTVTKFVPNREFKLENRTGVVRYVADFHLLYKPVGHTLVLLTVTVSTESGIIRYATPILERLARHELQTDMRALKIAVEGRLG